jgi:RimJ/RimL family protein N-acetyltransferase
MEPLYETVPDRIETARLVIRCARSSDAASLNAAICESIESLRVYMPWAQAEPSLEESEAQCRRMQANFLLRQDLSMLMFERTAGGFEGAYVGGTGLHRIDWKVRRFEIGYWCRASAMGKGFVTEATNALAALAFDQLRARRVEIRMDDTNQRSWRVAEPAGFALEGVFRSDALTPEGEPRDTRVYAKVREHKALVEAQ